MCCILHNETDQNPRCVTGMATQKKAQVICPHPWLTLTSEVADLRFQNVGFSPQQPQNVCRSSYCCELNQ